MVNHCKHQACQKLDLITVNNKLKNDIRKLIELRLISDHRKQICHFSKISVISLYPCKKMHKFQLVCALYSDIVSANAVRIFCCLVFIPICYFSFMFIKSENIFDVLLERNCYQRYIRFYPWRMLINHETPFIQVTTCQFLVRLIILQFKCSVFDFPIFA